MSRPRRYAIVGTGALGGFYGARLCRAGSDVHFLLHTDYDHVRRNGLVVESKDGDFTLPQVQAYQDVGAMPKCDVVVVALKATSNHLLPSLLPPLLADDGAVVLMQNGMGGEAAVAAAAPGHAILGGLCFLCSTKPGPGHIRHTDYGMVRFAAYNPNGMPLAADERARAIAQDFANAGIPVEVKDDLTLARWQKLVWNIPMSGLSVVLDADSSQLMASAHARLLAEEIMVDVVAGAAACGRTIRPDFPRKMIEMTMAMAPYKASMKLDFDQGKPMEIEAIYGEPLRLAQAAGGAMPLVQTLYRQLLFLDETNQAKHARRP